ncbi:hypothetical protein DPMN_055970 [Dreissena polymorpha]|uniref:Uncharacterized protein n=1 Tax=Dreissena polymorpha TaxID=45954 RepID=A0A9D4CSC3_DREPO|nr:hypothetical protein DPMN_055970 [Dreissena polymorpha]
MNTVSSQLANNSDSIQPFLLLPQTASSDPSSIFLVIIRPGNTLIGLRNCAAALMPTRTVIWDLSDADTL